LTIIIIGTIVVVGLLSAKEAAKDVATGETAPLKANEQSVQPEAEGAKAKGAEGTSEWGDFWMKSTSNIF